MFSKPARLLFVLMIGVMIISGCGQPDNTSEQASTSQTSNEKLTVLTSFYPIYISTINVTHDIPDVEVINMTKPQTGCLHDYQLTPEDLEAIEKADVFVVNGAGMEAFLDKAMNQQPNLKIVEASQGIELIKDDNGEENPHVWVSITDNIAQVRNIAEQLSSIDSAHATQYKSNAEEYINKLETLRTKMHQSLDGVKNRNIITFHESFPYFAQEFNLNIAAVIEREPGTEPSPRELEQTIEIVKASQIKALFAEPQYPAKAAETIARETGARVYTLDPAVSGDSALDSYIKIMEQNLTTLGKALK
ncbi:MAG TPA: metal ABC transporter substrate-binding protein [Syntrophomonadaceae bacterium]|nr:metal ABC transporter substrate-binding protein [Syntrophomonadaceae bacterium]HNX29745.1 metal ABC transporter substrate-binding protein [Syntrophomonadaceae bacterium]HPR94219.1 metal ABC transporter substrate-binding protein [Syntrophomonadaceae bacterium]